MRLAETVGSSEVKLQLDVRVGRPVEVRTWEKALRTATKPKTLRLQDALAQTLTEERQQDSWRTLRLLSKRGVPAQGADAPAIAARSSREGWR